MAEWLRHFFIYPRCESKFAQVSCQRSLLVEPALGVYLVIITQMGDPKLAGHDTGHIPPSCAVDCMP